MSKMEMGIEELNKVSGGSEKTANSRSYIVKNGDTLWDIAVKYYNDGTKWQKIYDANKGVIGSRPDEIMPGMKLIIP